MLIVGIDPGLTGAFAYINTTSNTYECYDTPAMTTQTTKKHHTYNLPSMAALLDTHGAIDHLYIERAQPMPGQGVVSMFAIGYGFGLWEGMIVSRKIPYTIVSAVQWKKALGLNRDKELSRHRAMQLFPCADLHLKKHHGRAEALLLAHYGVRVSHVHLQTDS